MQASGSFELARNGRKRPSNLLKTRDTVSDLTCYSPSFNPAHSSRTSPRHADGLPPTPVTAGMPKDQLEEQQAHPSAPQRSPISLPSINDMLLSAPSAPASSLLTPPASGRMGSLAPLIGSDSSDDDGRFPGHRPTWVQDSEQTSFVGVRPPISRQFSQESRHSAWSPRAFDNLAQEEDSQGVVGLGFGMSDATPRIGCFGSNALGLHTPTQSSYSRAERVPSAPSLAQDGHFESTIPSSPISPPLRGWNTDLRRPTSRPSAHIGVARPRPASIAMEREQPVAIEGGMPKQTSVYGLGVSLSGNMDIDFTKAPEEHRIATTSAVRLDGPAISPVSSSVSAADKFRDRAAATGLTPTLSMARIQDVENNPLPSPSSPSLRSRSKKRSDLVRRQAEAAMAAGLATRDPITPSSDSSTTTTSELSDTSSGRSDGERNNSSASQLSSPRKRALSVRDANANTSVKSSRTAAKTSPSRKDNPASPWGVFRLREEGWKPLGPPGGGKGVGISAVMKSNPSVVSKKQKRLTVSGSSRPASRDNDHNKENPVSASVLKGKQTSNVVGGKRPSTAGAKLGDVFGVEHSQTVVSKPGRFAHVHTASRPSSAHGVAPKKRSPLMGVR